MAKRENGTGSIVKRKLANGTKYYAYTPCTYIKDDMGAVTSKRILIGCFEKKSEARQALEEWIKHPTEKINYTLEDVYNDWSPAAFDSISSQTKTNYETCWQKIKAFGDPSIAKKQIKEITTGELRAILKFYSEPRIGEDGTEIKGLSKSYISKMKALLTQLYRHAVENNIVDRNYAELVKLPKMEDGEKRAFSDTEFAILEKGYSAIPGGDAVYALCYLGFRVSEFCELTVFSYDSKNKTLTGGMKTEAGKNRVVPIHKKIQPIVERWASRNGEVLYCDENGKAYNKDSFRKKVWKPVMEALGLPDELTPHSARHTCATLLAAGGARPEDIQRILGHSDYSVTANTYVNQDVNTLADAVSKMA